MDRTRELLALGQYPGLGDAPSVQYTAMDRTGELLYAQRQASLTEEIEKELKKQRELQQGSPSQHRQWEAAAPQEGQGGDLAAALYASSKALTQQGRSDEAFATLRDAFALSRRLHGDAPHEDTGKVLSGLGICFWQQGSFPEALRAMEEACKIFVYLHGPNSLEVAGMQHNMAHVHLALGETDKALEGWKEGLRIQRARLPGEPHLLEDVVGALNNIAAVQQEQSRLPEALASFEDSLGMSVRLHGDEHPNIGRIHVSMGAIRGSLGLFGEALRDLDRALGILRTAQGEASPEVGDASFIMASVYEEMGNAPAAQGAFLACANIYMHALGPFNWKTQEAFRRGGMFLGAGQDQVCASQMN